MTSTQSDSIAPTSLSCFSPFSSTITPGAFPVANISAKTSFPCLLLIFPSSTRLTNSFNCFAGIGHSPIELFAAPSALRKSFKI